MNCSNREYEGKRSFKISYKYRLITLCYLQIQALGQDRLQQANKFQTTSDIKNTIYYKSNCYTI